MFNNQPVKIIMDSSNNPWFKGKDVAKILGYIDTDQVIRKHVDIEDKAKYGTISRPVDLTGPTYNEKSTVYINEPGLYSLILSSNKPEAKSFKRWVTSDVLPSIRKYGEYKLQHQNYLLLQSLNHWQQTSNLPKLTQNLKLPMIFCVNKPMHESDSD